MDNKLFLLLSFLFTSAVSFAQTTTVSQDSMTVGDKINLQVSIAVEKGALLTPPNPEKDFGKLTVHDWSERKTEGETTDTLTYDFVISTYKPETCTIPQLPFLLDKDTLIDTLYSESKLVRMISVLPTDTNVTIKELKPLQNAGKAPLWWIWLLGAVVIAAAAVILIRLLGKKKTVTVPVIPPKPPYEEAIEALGELEKKNLVQLGYIKEYVFELSEIFKRYIGRRFEVNASEFTTEEMLEWLDGSKLSKELRMNAEWFFRTSDPVKFAKYIPEMQVISRFAKEVKSFLDATRPLPPAQENSVQGETGQSVEKTA